MRKTICGANCDECPMNESCAGCVETGGRPFSGDCMLANCCKGKGYEFCASCDNSPCALKKELIAEFNALNIPDMDKVEDLNALSGAYVNLEYTLSNGQKIKLLDDAKIYLGNQLHKNGADNICYGIVGDENYLLVCKYGDFGADPEIVLYKKRK